MKILFILLFPLILRAEDLYNEKVQKIFNQRCIACHSCYDSPCQLNLQNYSGFERGMHPLNVYNGTRLDSATPTRLEVDGKNIEDWRNLKFTAVHHKNIDESLIYNIIRKKPLEVKDLPAKKVEDSNFCPNTVKKLDEYLVLTPDLKMPYGFQPIEEDYQKTLEQWLKSGAKGDNRKVHLSHATKEHVEEWEKFFNEKNPKQKLVSRYIYEHLFLAHIYFEEDKDQYFRLVRSKKSCDTEIDEINTRRPNDFPGTEKFYYCLKPITTTIVAKTHMPFLFDRNQLGKIKNIFFENNWEVNSSKKFEDAYSNTISENPFLAFKDIPTKARYKFLLEYAHFMVSTFIKGPVCNGSNALNSIQEQFYVIFLKPENSFLVNNEKKDNTLDELLMLPGVFGSDVKLSESLKITQQITERREQYRKLKNEWISKEFPHGFSYDSIWNGDNENSNAVLTVFRHDDNAVVVKGFKGDLSKTAFVLDYSLFERLVYNLVVNFDVFGNIGHQLLTRVYMDYIRMEAEENFLLFMPKEQRMNIRKRWYKGIFTDLKMKYYFPLMSKDIDVNINYKTKEYRKEFFEHLIKNYYSMKVLGESDEINWKKIDVKNNSDENSIESKLRQVASEHPYRSMRYPNFFPETSILMLTRNNGKVEVYSIVKNSEHQNISWILAESLRLAPEEDTLTILKGFYAFYPNYIFKVNESKLTEFVFDIKKMKNKMDKDEFYLKYGLSRVAPEFWKTYDELNEIYAKDDSQNFGYLDLSRYLNQ